jgi:hypothetical protein
MSSVNDAFVSGAMDGLNNLTGGLAGSLFGGAKLPSWAKWVGIGLVVIIALWALSLILRLTNK